MYDISAYASAIRTDRWMEMYEKITSENTAKIEFVFVGPYTPDYTLPDNFRFTQSNFKPGQCFEIAARQSTGKALLQLADDIEYTPGAIDLMFNEYIKDPEHIMASCHYWLLDTNLSNCQNFEGSPLAESHGWPNLPVCGLYDREIHYKIGGADKRFWAVQWELDMYNRLYVHGLRTVMVDGICREVIQEHHLCNTLGKFSPDRGTLLAIWENFGNFNIHRKDAVQSYDENIMSVEQ